LVLVLTLFPLSTPASADAYTAAQTTEWIPAGTWEISSTLIISDAGWHAGAQMAYVPLSSSNRLALVDTVNHFFAAIDLGAAGCSSPRRAAISPSGEHVYVSCSYSDNVAVIDTTSNAVVAMVSWIPDAEGITFIRDGAYALVGSSYSNQIVVIDTTTYYIRVIPTPDEPRSIVAHPYLPRAYATCANGTILVIDTTSFEIVATIPAGGEPWDVAMPPDGQWLFVSDRYGDGLAVIDPNTNAVHTTLTNLGNLAGLAISPDGATIYACGQYSGIHVIDRASLTRLTTVPATGYDQQATTTCDGNELYVVNGADQIAVLALDTYSMTDRIWMPGAGTSDVAICPQYVATGIHVTPPRQTNSGARGQMVTHQATLVNTSGITDTFSLALGSYSWDTALSTAAIGPIPDGDWLTFSVYVTVPAGTDWYSTDTVVVSATSVTSPTVYTSTAEFTTQAYAPPEIRAAPNRLTSTQFVGQVVTQTLIISNGNAVTGTFTIFTHPQGKSFAVAGAGAYTMQYLLSGDPELGDYTFTDVGNYWTYSTLEPFDGVIIAESDYGLSETEAAALRQFFESNRPVILGMDDVDNLPTTVQGDVYATFGVANATDGDFYAGTLNPDHPIANGLTNLYSLGNDNDHFTEDGAVWVVRGIDGYNYVLAYQNPARSVIFGEALDQWWNAGNLPLIRNAINWAAASFEPQPWLILEPVSGTVGTNSSQLLAVTFDAAAQQPGTYTTQIIIQSNDTLTPSISIPITMTALPTTNMGWVEGTITDVDTGEPLAATVIALGQPYTVTTDPGTGTYKLWLDAGSYTLQAAATGYVSATTAVDIVAQQGTSQDLALERYVPRIGISPLDVESIQAANAQATKIMTITNAGPKELAFEIEVENLEKALTALNTNYQAVIDAIPNSYNFSEGTSGYSIYDGGYNMYDYGNYLSTDLGGSLYYADNTVVDSTYFGPTGRYFTRKYPGLFVLVAEMDGVDSFQISGGLGADGTGSVDGTVLQASKFGVPYRGFVKRVYDADVPSVNHLIIVPDNYSAGHGFPSYTNDDYHQVYNLSGTKRLYYLLYAGTYGHYIDDGATLEIMKAFLEALGPSPADSWLSVEPAWGTVPARSSLPVRVTFDARGVQSSIYSTTMLVQSTDPLSPTMTVTATMVAGPGRVFLPCVWKTQE